MRILKLIAIFIAGLLLILTLAFIAAGILIPSETVFEQETELDATQETVWNVLNDRERYPEWQDQLLGVEIEDENRWTEIVIDAGPIAFEYVRKEKPDLIEIKYSAGNGFEGTWRGEIQKISESKTLIVTTDKSIVKSWVMKAMMSMFFDLEDFARDWNQNLKKRVELIEMQN